MIFTKIFRSICLATSLLLITIESCFSRNLTRCASFVSPSELFFVFCFVFAFYTFYFLCHFPSSSLLRGCQCNQLFHSFRVVFPLLLRFRPPPTIWRFSSLEMWPKKTAKLSCKLGSVGMENLLSICSAIFHFASIVDKWHTMHNKFWVSPE